jgi:DNA-binding transcriptional ArsR family regulator
MTASATDELTRTFAALADPTRRAILTRLAAGEATVGQLAEPFALTQQAISKHIKVLEQAGLVSRSRAAQARPCRIEPARFDVAADWIGRHRQVWHERYDRLDQHLAGLQAAVTKADDRAREPEGPPMTEPEAPR